MDIPIEVLVYLFKYLPPSDRVAAGKTCRLWYEAASDSCFQSKECVCFMRSQLQDGCYPLNVYGNHSLRPFTNFAFGETDMTNKMTTFWEENGYHMKYLELNQCDMQEKIFVNVLNSCPNLVTLVASNCRELFMSARFVKNESEGFNSECLKKLKTLDLSQNRYLSDALFDKLTTAAESLEQLNLSDCPVSFHSGLYKKFYPFGIGTDGVQLPSESVLTFHYILEFIKLKGQNLKKLAFNKTLIDGVALKSISQLPDLKITHLEVFGCDQLNNEGFLALANHQINLVELNIGMCSRVTDQTLVAISKNLKHLKSLCIKKCRAVTNLGITELWNLKNLQTLDISQCEQITEEGIKNGICKEINTVLLDLNICALNLSESTVIMISEMLPNLRALDINYCFTSVTDSSIQAVFKNLLFLRSLKISHCDAVSDAGLTGMGTGKMDPTEKREVPIQQASRPREPFQRISLRSRAEEEIVRDAKRKKDVREMCESFVGATLIGYSMTRLKNLQHLDISGCNKITDVSLTYAFNCSELKTLHLSECQQITYEGLKYLSENCPSLEHIYLVNCYNIRDEGITALVKNLHRLKELHLRGCNPLTDASLRAIESHCRCLKVLDIQGCHNTTPEVANTLLGMPTLHTLLISKPGPYLTKDVQPPPAPPLNFLSFSPRINPRRRIF